LGRHLRPPGCCARAALGQEDRLPAGVISWLGAADSHPLIHAIGGKRLELAHLGQVRAGERLLRLTLVGPDDPIERACVGNFALTGREAEVLLWIARRQVQQGHQRRAADQPSHG